jgi:hypothetical protein
MMLSSPPAHLTGYQKMKTPLKLWTETTPSATRDVHRTELVRFVEGGPTNVYVLHSANSTLNSPRQMSEASGLLWPTLLG